MSRPTDSKKASNGQTNIVVSAPSLIKLIFVAASFLSVFMVAWIMIFPSSWLMGFSERHDKLIHNFLVEGYDGRQISPKVVTKYAGHPAIQFSHILPAAVWSAAIPFQLHPGFRKSCKSTHRRIGYVFLSSSLLMTIGMFLIVIRKLTYEYDYEGEAPPMAPFDAFLSEGSIICMGLWFAFTSVMALVKAKSKDFQLHKHYIYRHCGSGQWVAIQRIIVLASGPQKDAEHSRDSFGTAAMFGIVISMSLAELAVFLDSKQAKATKTQ
jgi:hypothetical protein